MAWRPYENLIEGELDNTEPGRVTGYIRFVDLDEVVRFDLEGDFHRDIRGKKIRLSNAHPSSRQPKYMDGFAALQRGTVGDITAGLEPRDYVDYPYIEWYSEKNGRVVLELDSSQIKVIDQAVATAPDTSTVISR